MLRATLIQNANAINLDNINPNYRIYEWNLVGDRGEKGKEGARLLMYYLKSCLIANHI